MTKTKSTKRALLSAILALVMTVSMLVGTTFAWFTDSVTSAGNKISAGTLDVKLHIFNGVEYVDISDATDPIFGENGLAAAADGSSTRWEPGKTQVAYLAIENAGDLALKYRVALSVTEITKNLNDVVTYTITPDAKAGDITAWDGADAKKVVAGEQIVSGNDLDTYVEMQAGDMHYFALSVHMDDLADNDYMGGSITFDLTVLATQLGSEQDSFGSDYDGGLGAYVVGGEPGIIKEYADGSKIFYSNVSDMVRLMALPENVGAEYAVPAGVTHLGSALAGNDTIKELTIPSSLVYGRKSLQGASFDKVILEEGITTIPDRLFYRTNVKEVVIPDSVTTIETSAFQEAALSELTVPANVETIGDGAFAYMPNLETVVIESGAAIPNYAFRACPNLKIVIIEGECDVYNAGTTFSNTEAGGRHDMQFYITSQEMADKITAVCGALRPDDNFANYNVYTVTVVEEISDGFYKGVADKNERTYYGVSGESVAAFSDWRATAPTLEYGPISAYFTLLGDVDMAGIEYTPFNGQFTQFDGNGFTISNLSAGQGGSGKSGLVSYLGGGIIKNLTLENASAKGCQVGLFAGQSEGGKIVNCFIAGTDNLVTWEQNNTDSYVETWGGIGAVVGYCSSGNFEVTILDGAVVAIDENGMTTEGTKVDGLIGCGAANGTVGGIVNNGVVCGAKLDVEVDSPEELMGALTDDSKEIYINVTSDISLDIGTGTKLGGEGTEKIVIKGATGNEVVTFSNNYRSYLNSDATLYLEDVKVTHLAQGTHWHDYCLLLNCDVVAKNVEFLRPVAVDSVTAVFDNVTFNLDTDEELYSMFIVAGSDVSIANSSITSQRGIKIADEDAADKTAIVKLSVSNTSFNTTKKSAILVGSIGGADITIDNVDITNVAADSVNAVWVDSDYPQTYDIVTVSGATKAQEE